MTKVFMGGSRKITRLNKDIKGRIDNIIQKEYTVLIGDANGADKSVQKYLFDKGYKNVRVFCMERCKGHPLEGFCQAKKIFRNKKSQIFCIIKQNNTTV